MLASNGIDIDYEYRKYRVREFEERCKKFAENKSMTKQSSFIRRCRYYLLGIYGAKKWDANEKEIKLNVLEMYFPGSKKILLEYEKCELESLANRERIRKEKDKLREVQGKLF